MSEIHKLKEMTIKDLYSLLVSGNQPVTLSQLQRDYHSFTGDQIPFYQMGFSNLESFLRDCPSSFRLRWKGANLIVSHIPTAGVEHIESLIKKQKPKKTKPQKSSRNYPPRARNEPVPPPLLPTVPSIIRGQIRGILMDYSKGILGSNFGAAYSKRFGTFINCKLFGFTSLLEMLKSMPDIVRVDQDSSGIYKVYPAKTKTKKSSPSDFSDHQNLPLHNEVKGVRHLNKSVPTVQDEDDWQDHKFDDSGVNLDTQMNIQQLLAKHKDGIWSAMFQDEYKSEFRKELDLHQLGFTSIINLMSNLPHIVTIQRASPQDWLLFDARHKKQVDIVEKEIEGPEAATSKLDPFNMSSPIDKKLKDDICQAISHFQQGLRLDELPVVFWKLTGKRLVPSDSGYNDIHSLITAMRDVIDVDYSTGAIVLHSHHKAVTPAINIPHKCATETGMVDTIPYDVIGPGSAFSRPIITRAELEQSSNYLEVFVATVVSPENLWLQIKSPDDSDQLDEMMDRIQILYSSNELGDAYLLPDDLIQPDQVCAAIYPPEGSWHRCQITAIKGKGFVELFYVDYGTTYTVTSNSLKFLRWCDFQLPAQAIPAKLGNLKPKNGVWTNEAKNLILSLVTDKPLFAYVTEVALNGTLTVCLTDTTGAADVHITDELIESGLAELDITDTETILQTSLPSAASERITVNSSDSHSRCDIRPTETNGPVVEHERYVKFVQLTTYYSCHIICYNDKPYVTTAEVSKLLWPDKDDILRIRLQQIRLPIERLLILQAENPLLFYELIRYHIDGTRDDSGKEREFVSVVELKSVLHILQYLEHPCPELQEAISREIASFDPFGSPWMHKMARTEEQQMIDYFQYKMDSALNGLHHKRMSILSAMQSLNSKNKDILVHSQNEVEKKIDRCCHCCQQLHQLQIPDC